MPACREEHPIISENEVARSLVHLRGLDCDLLMGEANTVKGIVGRYYWMIFTNHLLHVD